MAKPKHNHTMRITTNSQVYKRARKRYLESKALIHCSVCVYHRGENLKRWKVRNVSWKNRRSRPDWHLRKRKQFSQWDKRLDNDFI